MAYQNDYLKKLYELEKIKYTMTDAEFLYKLNALKQELENDIISEVDAVESGNEFVNNILKWLKPTYK